MSAQHEQQIIEEDDDDVELTRREIVFSQMQAKGGNWPKAIGVVEIVVGIILSILGALEIFIVPMSESKDGDNLVIMNKTNCYGAGFFAGVVMVLTGSTAVRSTLSRRDTTVFRFFNLTILSLIVYTALTLLLILGYSEGWTSPDKYKPGSRMREVHTFVTIFTVLGLIFAVTGFIQYVEVICCGEVPLWSHWVACLCPCVYNKVMIKYYSTDDNNGTLNQNGGQSFNENSNGIGSRALNPLGSASVVPPYLNVRDVTVLDVNDSSGNGSVVQVIVHI